MAEVLFILTTIFVAYVVFVVVECEKRKKEESKPKARPVAAAKAEPTVKAETAVKSSAPSRRTPASAAKPAAAAKPQAPAASSDTLKNPKTGEVVKVTGNYRFAKRWIKEALVSEGLLDKIYKNNEIDDAATAKINAAIEQLKTMKKYH